MMTVCAECGKRIVVTWPEFYVYKRGKGEDTCYFCSENCMIVSDVRDTKERSGWNDEPWITEGELEDIQAGRKPFRMLRRPTSRNSRPPAEKDRPGKPAERTGQEMGNNKSSHKLTREEKEKAVELAIAGKDPIGYLKECGCKNPWASWAYIKNVLKKSKPELYAQLPGDDDRLGEEVSFGAQDKPPVPADIQTPAGEGDPSTAPGGNAQGCRPFSAENEHTGSFSGRSEPQDDTKDALEGFVAFDPGAPEGDKAADLVINAEDLAAAEDPAVKRMEAMTAEAEPVVEKKSMGLDEALRKMDEALKSPEFMEVRQTADGITIRKKKPSYEVMELFGIPCEVTGVKLEGFEFGKVSEGLRVDFPGGSLLWGTGPAVPVILGAEQWKRLAEILPKVMKILRIE
ncbi:MAG: hypothetical protein IJU38_06815 [Clostridia bacterium]|nr:hypothetical protein [Clostridia bacterium]